MGEFKLNAIGSKRKFRKSRALSIGGATKDEDGVIIMSALAGIMNRIRGEDLAIKDWVIHKCNSRC